VVVVVMVERPGGIGQQQQRRHQLDGIPTGGERMCHDLCIRYSRLLQESTPFFTKAMAGNGPTTIHSFNTMPGLDTCGGEQISSS